MSTRANIRFEDGSDFICIDRSHDGFPENVLQDIQQAIDLCEHRFSGEETGQLVSAFLGLHFDRNRRVQTYELCIGYERAGDESYCYRVYYCRESGKYKASVIE